MEEKALRKDKDLYARFLNICLHPNAKRGRQSFFFLFEYKHLVEYASLLITQVEDENVTGHVLSAIWKMNAPGYNKQMQKFTGHQIAWIRNVAKKYLQRWENESGINQ